MTPRVVADRLEWLRQVRAGEPGDPLLLITGLRENDPERWEIGVVHAWIEIDSDDGSASVWLRFVKPNKRNEGERIVSERRFDPETAFLLQAHVFYGGRLSMTWSESHRADLPYHYPRVLVPGAPFRFLRMIANTPSGRLPQVRPKNWRDLRRRNLAASITTGQASARHGTQNARRSLNREDAVARSATLYRPGLLAGMDTASDYVAALREVYGLLDERHPMGAASK